MGAFSSNMRNVAIALCTKLGNQCTLTKKVRGAYDPTTGLTTSNDTVINTYSAPASEMSVAFGRDGQNTNLAGFDSNRIVVPWIGQEIDETWLYNDQNILSVAPIRSQDDIIIYTISVGEKG